MVHAGSGTLLFLVVPTSSGIALPVDAHYPLKGLPPLPVIRGYGDFKERVRQRRCVGDEQM